MRLCEVIVLIAIFPESLASNDSLSREYIILYNETLQLIETSRPENKPDIFSCKIL